MAPAQEKFPPRPISDGENSCYTIFVRLPFPRGDFVDPPKVMWNPAKDRELWDLLARATSKARDLDWQATADRFGVSLAFLTQQAAWLYERQLSQVRAQLRKVNKPSSVGTSLTPESISGSVLAGEHAVTRGGRGGSPAPSSLSHRPKERTISRGEESMETPIIARGHPMSRTASNNTVTQTQRDLLPVSPHFTTERHSSFGNGSRKASLRSTEVSRQDKPGFLPREASPSAIASSSSSSSSSDSDAPHPMSRSRAFASRRPRFALTNAPMKTLSDADGEDEDSAPFLPFSAARPTTPPPPNDPGATVNISPKRPAPAARRLPPQSPAKHRQALAARTPHSSSSSSQSQPHSQNRAQHNPLSALSPKQRRAAKEESEGTPSMGSSFSDLDDASVTQSALEEALANEMPQGAIGSRMSTISQALRSRYL